MNIDGYLNELVDLSGIRARIQDIIKMDLPDKTFTNEQEEVIVQ